MTETTTLTIQCPKCGLTRTIGTKVEQKDNFRIRCSKKAGGCSNLFWSKNNKVELPKIVLGVGTKLRSPPITTKTDMELNFNDIANSSDFQRFVVYLAKQITPGLFKGVSTRVTSVEMKRQFNDKRGDYRLVMTELKEKLKERSEKE